MDEVEVTIGLGLTLVVGLLLAAPLGHKWGSINVNELRERVQQRDVQSASQRSRETTKSTATLLSRPLEGTLQNQVRYANLQFKVTRATISNQEPSSAPDQNPTYRTDRAYAYIQLTINNTLTSKDIPVDQNLVTLQLGDEKRYQELSAVTKTPMSEWSKWEGVVSPQITKEVQLVFPVPIDSTWKGAQLNLNQPGKIPATLPLDGPAPSVQYPANISAGGEVAVKDTTYKILGASVDLDNEGDRAEEGKHFLKLSIRVTYKGKSAGGIFVDANNFRLLIDGATLVPLKSLAQIVARNSPKEGDIVFAVPLAAVNATLQVGEIEQNKTAKIPLNLKGNKP
jgi:hypothetical protein